MVAANSLSEAQKAHLSRLYPRLKRFLPAELRNQLEGRLALRDLTQIAQSLESLRHNLSTYLTRNLRTPRPISQIPHSEWIKGTALFADLTGFTTLTERLRELGDEGAERLNTMLNSLFAAMLEPLTYARGELLEFAGDAITAYFPMQQYAEDALWATRAALRMMRALRHASALTHASALIQVNTPAPDGKQAPMLKMSIGLARGQFFAAEIGNNQRMEYLTTGGCLPLAMIAEGKAEPEEISVAPGMEALLGDHFRLHPGPDGHHIVVDDFGESLDDYEMDILSSRRRRDRLLLLENDLTAIIQAIEESLTMVEHLARFFPPHVLNLIVAHQKERQFTGEHRIVSIMFVNLRGFETLLNIAGPDALPVLTRWLNSYFITTQEVIHEAGGSIGHIVSYVKGFNLLCPFGAPLTDEEMPQRAVAAALHLNTHLAQLIQSLEEQLRALPGLPPDLLSQGPPLTQHIGITYGPIYTGSAGWRERREYVTLGDDVNLSARLTSQANSGQILISGEVYDRVYQAFNCKALPPMQFKGKTMAVPVYAVQRRALTNLWLNEAASGPLIGREESLSSLLDAVKTLQEGKGNAVMLSGETGIGKTRLIAEVARHAYRHNIEVLAGRCLAYAQTHPFTPWIEALWNWFQLEKFPDATARRDQIRQMLDARKLQFLAEALVTLLIPAPKRALETPVQAPPASPQDTPSLYARLHQRLETTIASDVDLQSMLAQQLDKSDTTSSIPTSQSKTSRSEVSLRKAASMWHNLHRRMDPGQAIISLLTELAQTESLILIIEDLQWIDQASQNVLLELTKRVTTIPLLLLNTMRPGDKIPTWYTRSGGELHTLAGLTHAGVAGLAATQVQMQPSPDLVEWLFTRTQGNPLFVAQLLHTLEDSGNLIKDPATEQTMLKHTQITLPPTVREIMLSRIDQLPEETRTLCKLAAVIGETVPFNLLARVSALSRPALMSHIAVLARRALWTPAPPAFEYTFAHPLLREAIYSSLSYSQRRAWHRAIADCLADEEANDIKTAYTSMEMLAHHYTRSDAPVLGARYSRLAGDRACTQQAWDEALSYYQQALSIEGPDAALRDEQYRTYEALGDFFVLQGQYSNAVNAYQHVEHIPDANIKLALSGLQLCQDNDKNITGLEALWGTIPANARLRPWIAVARGWLAHQASTTDEAHHWWRQGLAIAETGIVREMLQALLSSDIPTQYTDLLHALVNS